MGPRCNGIVFRLGACPSERDAAGTTAQQVKQSFFGALAILTTAIPVGDVLDAFLGARAAAEGGNVVYHGLAEGENPAEALRLEPLEPVMCRR
jgi:hypothetical protein